MTRVLVVVPAHEPLRESAADLEFAVKSGKSIDEVTPPAVPRLRAVAQQLGLGPDVELDTGFAAVAIGTAQPSTALESLRADSSDMFVVRADVPDEMARDGYVNGHPVFRDPEIAPFPVICGSNPAVGTDADVRTLHNVGPVNARGLDGSRVAIAIMDTGISSSHLASKNLAGKVDASVVWNSITAIAASGRVVPPGQHAVGHGTMSAFDALIAAPGARLLDYPILHGTGGVVSGSTMGGTLSDALQAYAHLEAYWLVTFGPSRNNYDSLVINNSWGIYHPSWDFPAGHPGRYIDNPNHPFNIKIDVMARHGIDILFAAGNCGSQCPSTRCRNNTTQSIMGANAHPEVLTLAGVSTAGDRIGYSSEGPPLPGLGAPQKPDLAAATHFDGSGAVGLGVPDNGTSASCPVAAGCVAALRTALAQPTFRPAQLFGALRSTAGVPPGVLAGWNPQFGHGIIDLDAAAAHLGV